MKQCNANKNCWNCPAAVTKGNVDFRACGQSKEKKKQLSESKQVMIECARRADLGQFEPTITFEQCPEWELNEDYNMYMLKNMRVMILGLDGYLGWTLALKLGKLGFKISGMDNYWRRDCVMEKGAHEVAISHYLTAAWVLSLQVLAWTDFAGIRSDSTTADYLNRISQHLPKRIRKTREKIDNDF